jgi:PAS domain S-box-containing protein
MTTATDGFFRIMVSWWKKGLRMGYHATTPGLLRGRVMLLNGLSIIASLSVIVFSITYALIGYQYYYGPLYIIPVAVLVLWLNSRGLFGAARNSYLIGSLTVISYWCYEGRGNGNEFTLIAIATMATLILEKRHMIILSNLLCFLIFVVFKVYDSQTPFIPDPHINYNVVPTVILLNTVGVVSFQIAFFRDLAKHYDEKLTVKYNEVQAVQEELKSNNEEIKAINDKLHGLTGQLEAMVKEKTLELQTYIDAIDVNLYSTINDLDGNFVQVNDQLVKASGYTREELIGKHYTLLATPAHQEANADQRRASLLAGMVWRGEVEHKSKQGELYWFDCVVMPIVYENGRTNGFLSIGLPITERKRHEQLREKTHLVLESIAFNASHKIRGPMARIKGLSYLIQKDFLNKEEYSAIAARFTVCADELSMATSELVNFVYHHQKLMNHEGTSPATS